MPEKRMIFRSARQPTAPIPVGTRSVGYYAVTASHKEPLKQKDFVQLFWCIEGSGQFRISGDPFVLDPHHVLLYLPGDTHDIQCLSRTWRYRWLTLDGPLNEQIVESYGFPRGVKFAGPCPDELFMKLESEIGDVTPNGERKAGATALSIVALASEVRLKNSPQDVRVRQWVELLESRFADPLFSVETLARETNTHRSLLCRLFKQRKGVSPVEYLISFRIQRALSLLKETDLPVHEIAPMVGYRDPNYFCKALKKVAGMNPSEFRKL